MDSIPTGITLVTFDGITLTAGLVLTAAQLENISFSPDANLNSSNTTFGSLTLSASDGTTSTLASISFTVDAVNDLPVLSINTFNFTEDTAGSFDLEVSDVDGDALTITVTTIPTGGVLTLSSGATITTGTILSVTDLTGITFTPSLNANSDLGNIGDFILSIEDGTISESKSISLIVSAVDDAPTLGEVSALDVLETIAADATLLSLPATEVDGETLTYSLEGADAELFNVDTSGNISFKASPNFKIPGDVGGDNTYDINLVATDSSGSSANRAVTINIIDVKPSGQAIDGYLVGATVWVDLDGDGIKDENEPETTTDKTGAFEFEDDIPADIDIYVEGGYDLGTGKPNEQKFKLTTSITGDGSEALVISPVSTQISRAYAKTGVTLAVAQEKVAKAYGLDQVFDNLTNFDPIQLAYNATSNEEAKAALTAQARNIMVSSLGEVSKKVSEYFATEIAPTTRSQISDIFKSGTQTLRNSTWDSGIDLNEQPRIVIELEGFEDLLASTSETFNDKIVEAILASEDLTKLFEMKSDGTGQFDAVITNATAAIILEIKNLILSEMGFDPATNFTTFKDLDGYTGETVTFLGATKTMGEWAVIMTDILDSQQPDPYSGRVNFGPEGGVTDMVGKYYAEQMVKMVRLMETMTGLTFENLTDAQIDQLVDMGFDYNRGSTFNEGWSRWVPFDEFGQELWAQNIQFSYSGERLRYDSNGSEIQGNTGQWQLTAEQVKAYLKDPTLQIKDGNWGNEFSTYNWTTKTGDLGVYLALAEGRTPEEVTTLMQGITATPDSITNFTDILTASFAQGTKVFSNLVTSALDFTLNKFEKFVEKTIEYENDEVRLAQEAIGLPVSTVKTVTIPVADATIVVTVVDSKFFFNGSLASATTLKSGATYTFDLSDASNAGNPLRFSETIDGINAEGTEYTAGITNTGTPGEAGATTKLEATDATAATLYIYSEAKLAMGNETVMTATPAATIELMTMTGIGWQLDANYGELNPVVTEAGIFSYAISGGPDAALFRISDQGTITFKDTAPDPQNPNDSDANGEYLITITITDEADGFTQDIEYVLAFPDWNDSRSYASDTYPTLDSNQQVIVIPEGQWVSSNSYYNNETAENVEVYRGIKLNVTGLDDDTSWLDLRSFDDEGNPIKDNQHFNIRTYTDDGVKSYYLTYQSLGTPVFDYEAPKDANGDNVYELVLKLNDYGTGTEIASVIELVVVITDSGEETQASFSDNQINDTGLITFEVSEYRAAVANVTNVEKNGTTLESYFVSGDAYSTAVRGNNPYDELITRIQPEDQTIIVTVVTGEGGRKYLFDGVETPNFTFTSGTTYTFDQSDASNEGHPLRFSDVVDGTHGGGNDWGSYRIDGTPGEAGAASIINTNDGTPTLYYYCSVHSGMGGTGVLTNKQAEYSYFTAEELLAVSFGGVVETTITGGADADLFYIFRSDGNNEIDLILFKSRPEFSNPSDANGDGTYEIELTKTDATGFSVTQAVTIEVREANEGEQQPITAPGTSLILEIQETTDSLTDGNSNRNIVGTDEADVFSKQLLDDGSKFVSGGLGDDVFSAGDDFLTGGEGSDTFLISLDRTVDLNKIGIIDDSVPYSERGDKEGIYGYDQNRDGNLDLSTELNHAWLNVIYDFTPGTDKLGLSTYGWSGTNVPSLRSEDVSYIQGTGDLSAHTLVVINNAQTVDRGYSDGGVAAVLLNTDASLISKETDEIVVGAKYESVLGNIGTAIGATTATVLGPNGEDVEVLQLADGQYVFVYANYSNADNRVLFESLAVSTSGEIYVPRGDGPDYEAPGDLNRDNIYEFLFSGQTFTDLKLKQEAWGGYSVDFENSTRTSDIAFTVFLEVTDDISDNVGKISIAEANFFSTVDAATGDAALDTVLVDLVFSQISAVQGSLQDIDMKAIAEEINFDFSFFATADARTQAEDWFGNYQTNSFDNFGRELEETFERNLLSKYSTYTNADSLSNLTGTAGNDTLAGTDAKETIFGKKGDDTITGGAGDDVIFGDQGSDTLDGGVGADSIDGGSGDDTIIIGEGSDVLDGGSGNDTFDFTNITDLPEFIKGGSGVDTLVLSGLSSSGLEYDDVNQDGVPDYTGIDLNKLVSIKETWTYENEAGETVSEEGWRNRVESIEAIDLRDSQSQINKDYNINQIDTVGFRLSSNKVTLTDSDGAVHSLYTSTTGSVLSANLVGASMNQTNLANIVSSDATTGISPVLNFVLDSIPAKGKAGSSTVTLKLYDGTDTAQATGERLLETSVVVNWSSDGETVTLVVPPQSLTINYLSDEGNALTRTWENADNDSLQITYDGETPQLSLRIASFFSGEGTAEGLDLTGYISSGDYFFDVAFSNLEFLDQNDNVFTSVQGGFKVAATQDITAYIDDVNAIESTESASVVVNLSKASGSDVTISYTTADGSALAGSDYTTTSGTLTIAAGQTSGTIVVPVTKDTIAEGPETLTVTLSDPTGASLGRTSSVVTINNESVFSDILNITWDALQRMSWDNRTWTINGDETDTVRLLGHEFSYNEGSTIKTQFEPFRFKGTSVEDGIAYNVYELWDGRVKIEAGVSVIYGKRELGKAVAGENTQPDFWYQYTTVYENSVAVFGKVKDSWDRDGDNITYSLDSSMQDAALFNIDSSTGEVTFKAAPNYEAPVSISSGASGIGSSESDFANLDQNSLRSFNQYRIKVIGNDGSGEINATNSQDIYIDVRNLPDYAGYDPTNKIPFFKDMWGAGSKFIDDAANQEIQIKGFDLNFDTLTWELIGLELSGDNFSFIRYGTNENGDNDGNAIASAPFTLSSTGVLKPNSIISYEGGPQNINAYVSITDGKSAAVTKQFYFQIEDTIGDGSLTVKGTAMIGSYVLGDATVWQDLDNDGIKDAGEPTTTTNLEGRFNLTISKSDTDTPILATGGTDMGSGLANTGLFKINSNLKLTSGREWGEYSLGPVSSISYGMQTIDRSLSDQKTVTDTLKAFGMDPLWMDGDGNFYGERFYDIRERLDGNSSAGEWETFNLNLFTLNNLVTLIGNTASKSAIQIINDALADVNAKVSGTANTSGFSSASLTTAQVASINQAAFNAAMESISELVTGKTAYNGFRLAEKGAVTITDHEGALDVVHTPTFSVSDGTLTLDSAGIEINQTSLQDSLDLKAGSKGLKIEVELGTLPSTADTIEFTGKLIDGTDNTISTGERSIEVRFQVKVDPTKDVGAFDYLYVPGTSDITVIYTGEDGTTTSSTVTHSGNMVTVATTDQGVPKLVVDFTEVFARGIPQTNLSSYFSTATASEGNYYTELDFTGANLQTSGGEVFNKVVSTFKVATSTTPVVYFNDNITVSEAEGWNQVELKLSKPATETFTLLYKFEGGTADSNEDYWWWSDNTGYRKVTFVEGQSTATVNVDIRNDTATEGDETFNISFQIAAGSEGKVVLPKSIAKVTIEDDESSTAFDYETMVDKVMSKISTVLSTELKTLTDASSASLSGSSTTFTNILLSNSDISDISTYLASEVSEDVALYDPIVTNLVNLVDTYVGYVRGPNGIRDSLKINGPEMAKDFSALANAFDEINLSEFVSTASDALTAAFIADILSDSGFKYNAATTAVPSGALVYDRTISTDADAYATGGFPGSVGSGMYIPGGGVAVSGTDGNDTATITNSNGTVYFAGEGDDTVTKTSGGNVTFFGGPGNDKLIENTDNVQSRDYFDGGPGNDILHTDHGTQTFYKGGTGNDIFVIDAEASHFDSGNALNIQNLNMPGMKSTDIENGPYIIDDFEDGVDKIGLFGSWSGKTIVVLQGTGAFSDHTFLAKGTSEKGGDSDFHYWAILWNTSASSITADDFVLVDSSYGTSTLSGVTISTSASDAVLSSEDASLDLSFEDASLEVNSISGALEQSPSLVFNSSLIEDDNGFDFDNIEDLNSDNLNNLVDMSDILERNDVNKDSNSSQHQQQDYTSLEDLREEEILSFLDTI